MRGTVPEAELTELWIDYKSSGREGQRNLLIEHYSSLVRAVASRLFSSLPKTIERQDLISYGLFGLIDAIDKFDPGRGNKFETYATLRIKGAIVDELRKQDWVPRKVRNRIKELALVTQELHIEFGRAPEDAELAQRMQIALPELWMIQAEAAMPSIGALDEHDQDDDRPSLGDTLYDAGANPEELLLVEEITGMLAGVIAEMSERDRTIVALYYLEELTLSEIGQALGLTETRVCQLQSRILRDVRASLASVAA